MARHVDDAICAFAEALDEMITFNRAVNERVIAESPAAELVEFKREKPIRQTPTWDQYELIVNEIRSQRFSDTAEDSADVVQFWALAGGGSDS